MWKMNVKNISIILTLSVAIMVGQGPVPGKPAERKGVKATTEDGRKILIYEDGTWGIAPKEIFNIPVGDSYFIGSKDAKVTVIEWMDYQ